MSTRAQARHGAKQKRRTHDTKQVNGVLNHVCLASYGDKETCGIDQRQQKIQEAFSTKTYGTQVLPCLWSAAKT